MKENPESESVLPATEEPYRYPWARSLMLIVLYGALLVFLWHFPTPGGRVFFRDLFRSLLTIMAGLAIVGVTLLVLLFILPAVPMPELDEAYDEDEAEMDDFVDLSTVLPSSAILVPALKKPATEPEILDLLYDLEPELDGIVLADSKTGIITVAEVGATAASYLIGRIRAYLKQAGYTTRSPR